MGAGLLAAAWILGVTVRVDNLSHVPDRDLQAAKSEVNRIFHAAGVEITWVDDDVTIGPTHLTLVLVNAAAEAGREAGDVAGSAVQAVLRAYVYCSRLDAVSNHAPVDAHVVLGRVIAHEIGHLLLPPNSHARVGIMRPQVDFRQVGFDGFTSEQIEALRRRLIDGRSTDQAVVCPAAATC